jgi:hypothetical protein
MTKQNKENIAQAFAALIIFVGLLVFTRGVWLAWRPGGWIVAGLAITSPALFWLYSDVRSSKER